MRIAHTADWHLGHPKVRSSSTIAGLRKFLLTELDVDLLCIAGDIFDRNISFDSDEASEIIDFLADVITRCYYTNTTLRVLQGTYTHDHNQLLVWDRLYKKLGLPVDYRLFRTLSIEHVQSLGINILYVPDDLPFKHKHEVFDRITDLLTTHGIEQVDYVIFHGEFDNTIYSKFIANAFSISDFDKICRGYILAGHVHSAQKHGKLIYAGSFNRLKHNEEEAKGYWIVNGAETTFIENTDALRFLTVDYTTDHDLDVILSKHQKLIGKLPVGVENHIRVIISDTHLKQALRSFHNSNHPEVQLTFKAKITVKDTDAFLEEKLRSKREELLEIPSIENLPRLICQHLTSQSIDLTIEEVQHILGG